MQTLTGTGSNLVWYANSAPSTIIGTGNTFFPFTTTTDTVYVTQTVNGCTSTPRAVVITVNALPNVSITGLNPQYAVTDPAFALTASPSGGSFSGPGVTGNQFDPAMAGIGGPYVITYTYTDPVTGCVNTDTAQVTVNVATGISVTPSGNAVSVYPNPAGEQMVVHLVLGAQQDVNIELYDVTGQIVMSRSIGSVNAGITDVTLNRNEQDIAAGAYWLRVQTGTEVVQIKVLFN